MGMSIDHSYIVAPVEYTTWEDELSVSIGKYPDGNFIRIGLCFPSTRPSLLKENLNQKR
jgi:hypothetical protein